MNSLSLFESKAVLSSSRLALVALALFAGCAAEGADGQEMTADDPAGELGIAQQALTENSCSTTTSDNVLAPVDTLDYVRDAVTSPDAKYDHKTCTHAYLVTSRVNQFNSQFYNFAYARYAGPIQTPGGTYPCSAMWSRAIVWKTGSNGQWTKVGDSGTVQGTTAALDGAAWCEVPQAEVRYPSAGVYRIVAQSGLITSYMPVTVGHETGGPRFVP